MSSSELILVPAPLNKVYCSDTPGIDGYDLSILFIVGSISSSDSSRFVSISIAVLFEEATTQNLLSGRRKRP